MAVPVWLREKLFQKNLLKNEFAEHRSRLRLGAPPHRRAAPQSVRPRAGMGERSQRRHSGYVRTRRLPEDAQTGLPRRPRLPGSGPSRQATRDMLRRLDDAWLWC
jgi:hypothetical protein